MNRALSRGRLLSVAIAMACMPALAARADNAADTRVSNVFFDTDLRQALEDVAAQAGVNIITDPSVGGLVTLELENVPVDKALELLLAGTEFQVVRTPDYYLVFTPDEDSAMFPSLAETRVIQINHVLADTARSLLPNALQRFVRTDDASNTLAITATEESLARILSDLAKIDTPAQARTHMVVLNYMQAQSALNLLPQSYRRHAQVDADSNALAITAPAPMLRRILEDIAEIDTPRERRRFDLPEAGEMRVVKLSHATSTMVLALLPEALHDYVRVDEESNTLAVSAPAQLMGGILADVAAIDTPRRHVMLDVRVVVMERGDLLNFGVDWTFPRIDAGTATSDLLRDDPAARDWPWEVRIGYTPGREFTNALNLRLNLLTQNEEATIISTPKVLAQDGKEAEISVTNEEWFQITTEAATFVRAQLQEIETGTILGITPRVGANGELTLDMEIEVSDVIARGAENLPVVSRRTARSTVQIESGGTAAVAGLVDMRAQQSRAGVPGAANVPLLGHAFRTDGLNHQARQVAVFVTATLVEQNDGYFETGRSRRPPLKMVDEDLFRLELEEALDQLLPENEGR